MDSLTKIYSDIDNTRVSDSFLCSPEQCNSYLLKHNSSLKIIHLNIRSVNQNYSELLILLHRIKIDFDVIILTECWLSKVDIIPALPGFNSHCSSYNNQNEGVILYSRINNNLKFRIYDPKLNNANCLICEINQNIAIIAIYRSPSYKNIDNFINSLTGTLTDLASHRNVAIIGDININITTDKNDPQTELYLNAAASHGLLPAHNFPTRENSCLDHILLKTNKNTTTLILDTKPTDHSPVLLFMEMTSIVSDNHKEVGFRFDRKAIKCDIEKTDFSEFMSMSEPHQAAECFITTLSNIIKSNTQVFNISSKKRIIKPWITPGLLRCIRNRDRLHKKYKQNQENNVLKITYTRYRNFCGNLLKNLKHAHERDELKKANGNIKATWDTIKKIAQLNKNSTSPKELLTSNSINEVNTFFNNVGKNLANKIKLPPAAPDQLPTNPDAPQLNSLVLQEVDSVEIEAIIMRLKNNSAPGWDNIPNDILKSSARTLIPPITHLCNLCLTSGTFPNSLKRAIVIPIHKGGDGDSVNNYRPISLLNSLSKILEKVLNKRLVDYLEKFNLISKNQYGFRRGRSTEDAVLALTDYITNQLDNKKKCIGIFLDLAKAFDTVSIPFLLQKLEKIGVRGIALKMFYSYLSERTQRTKIDSFISEENTLTFGVPQGSILGPTLFIIYINSICRLSPSHCKIVAYADDTVLLLRGETWEETSYYAENALRDVLFSLSLNSLTLNTSKTKYITFAIKRNLQPKTDNFNIRAHTCGQQISPDMHCDCQCISRTTSIKYLGVVIDSALNWHEHLISLKTRLRKLIFIFKSLRSSCDASTLFMVYKALAQSIQSYCITAWGGADKTYFLGVERAQRAILKVMLRKPIRFPTEDLYVLCNVLTVRQLFVLQMILRKHKSLYYYPNPASPKRRNYTVGETPQCRTTFAQRQFRYLSTYLYNKTNKLLSIYPHTKHNCKILVTAWLLKLSYEDTESILHSIS